MIYDNLSNVKNYEGLGRVSVALKFLAETDLSELEPGRYDLDGDNIYYMIQSYDTRVGSTLSEAHTKYIDIQCMLDGCESVGVAQLSDSGRAVEEKPENDYCLYECDTQSLVLNNGDFLVLYPNDVHLPGCAIDTPKSVRKVVVKVRV